MQDSSPFRWLEDRGPACQLIALIDDATQSDPCPVHRARHHGRESANPWGAGCVVTDVRLAHYTDKNSIFRNGRPAAACPNNCAEIRCERSSGEPCSELGIEWIAAHSPQAKGRIERLFETLQDRLVKEMRLAGIDSIAAANHFLEMHFLPEWEQRFTVAPAEYTQCPSTTRARTAPGRNFECARGPQSGSGPHRQLGRKSLGSTAGRSLCGDCVELPVEIERRLDGSHWLRFRGRYVRLRACPERRTIAPQVLPAYGLQDLRNKPPRTKNKIKPKYHVPPNHPWRKSWKRTFLSSGKPDISTLR